MVDKNDTLLREVEEELRREQFAKLWDRYGIFVVGAVALLLLAVGGNQFWQARSKAAAEAAGARYEAARLLADESKLADALHAFEALSADGPEGYAALSRLQVAGALAKTGKPEQSLAAYEALANDSRADPLLRGFARLQAAAARMGEAGFTEIENRLNDLISDAGPWRSPARELLGVAALKAGKLEEARTAFEKLLGDQQTPPAMADRARLLLATIIEADQARKGEGVATEPAKASDPSSQSSSDAGAPKNN